MLRTGNYGKAVGVERSKKSQSREELRRSREDLNEEGQGLLESEEELDREEVLSPEPESRSLSAPARPQPTEYDRYVTAAPSMGPCSVVIKFDATIGQSVFEGGT